LRLEPLRFDPRGAFAESADPIARLCSAIAARRKLEEEVRFAYVAITRAVCSVVLGLPEKGAAGVQELLRLAWTVQSGEDGQVGLPDIPGVSHRPVEPLPEIVLPPSGVVLPRTEAVLSDLAEERSAWLRQAPSSVEGAMSDLGLSASALGHTVAASVVKNGGYQPPLFDPIGPPEGHPEEQESHWGTLVHAWFAYWGFSGESSLEAASTMLRQDLGVDNPALAAWLVEVATSVAAHPDARLWRLVTKPGVQLHFELPLLGVARLGATRGDPLLLAGRTDLLVRDPSAAPERRWTVIDFKAGASSPRYAPGDPACGDLAKHLYEGAHLRAYGPQLEAYRESLNGALAASGLFGAGAQAERIGDVALWFVRSGAGVWWDEEHAGPKAAECE